MTVKKRVLLKTVIFVIALITLFTFSSILAWYSNLPLVYTSDLDPGHVVRIGMRINLLFERLRTSQFANGRTITYGDGITATFDSSADWGTAENPYIISMPRHIKNLYALQRSGYFKTRYIDKNYSDGSYIANSKEMPYFLVCDTDGTPVAINGGGAAIQPIGNESYPFIGCVGGAQVSGTSTAPNGMSSTSSIIANYTVKAENDDIDVGFFGKIGYLGDVTSSGNFNGAISSVNDLLLYDVKIDASFSGSFSGRSDSHLWGEDISNSIRYQEDHHIGIFAGHIEYAQITNISVYYSTSDVEAIKVSHSSANYHSDSGIIGLVYNLNPVVSGNQIGSSSGTTIVGTNQQGGNEWGGSIAMKDLHTRLQNVLTAAKAASTYTYPDVEVVVIEPDGTVSSHDATHYADYATATTAIQAADSTASGLYIRTYVPENGWDSYVFADDSSSASSSARYCLFHGKSATYFSKKVITYTKYDEYTDAWYIYSGSGDDIKYLAVSGTTLTYATSEDDAAKWIFDGSNHLYTKLDLDSENSIKEYYLNKNGTYGLILGDVAGSATVWNKPAQCSGGSTTFDALLYTTVSSTNYYVDFVNNGWRLVPYMTYYYLDDGSGNYLSMAANGSSARNVTSESDSVRWMVSNPTGSGTTTLSTIIGDTTYYLSCDGSLSVSGSPYNWTWDNGALYATVQGIRFYIVFDSSQGLSATERWKVMPASGKKITDGSGNYLTATSSSTGNAGSNTAVVWQFSSASDPGDTEIYTVIGGEKYYLTYDSGLAVSSSSSVEKTWHRSGNTFYITIGGKDYYLQCSSGSWDVLGSNYFLITDNQNHYLRVLGQNSFTSGSSTNATPFYFSAENGTSSQGTIWCYIGEDKFYLVDSNGVLQTSTSADTSFTNDGSGNIVSSASGARLGYDGAWGLFYYCYIRDNSNHYLNNDVSSGSNTLWLRTASGSGYKFSYTSNGSTYYLRVLTTTTGGCDSTTTYSLEFSTTDSDNVWIPNNNNRYYVRIDNSTSCYLYYTNGAWTVNTSNNTAVTLVQGAYPNAYLEQYSNAAQAFTIEDGSVSAGTALTLTSDRVEQHFEKTSVQTVVKSVATGQRGGYDTYFPLMIDPNDTTVPYEVASTNTGYVVGGTNNTVYQMGWGDVRIASYPMTQLSYSLGVNTTNNTSNLNGTYSSSKLEILTRTYKTGDTNYGLRRIQDLPVNGTTGLNSDLYVGNYENTTVSNAISGYTKTAYADLGLVQYGNARRQLGEIFAEDSSNVYGLHFMDAVISMSHLITAPKVKINGTTYYDYQMPEDSIDFRLRTSGYITFFAGTYYANSGNENDSFFSLYEITRNGTVIDQIKRIEEIWGDPTDPKKAYIYKYENQSLPSTPSGYVKMFDTSWIEAPHIVLYTLYYYEIPVNAGEYALGSVSGGKGAYLCYLDIGTSAAQHTSAIGSIDFVYDNGSRIVVVKDNEYIPSLAVVYTDNAENNNAAVIDEFTIKVRRTKASGSNTAELAVIVTGDDKAYIKANSQTNGDTVTVTRPNASP